MQRWYFTNKEEPYRPYDIIKYTGVAGYSSKVVYPGLKSIDRSTYCDDEDAINYPIGYKDNSCETWLKFKFKDWWEGYTAFKNVRIFVSAADPGLEMRFGQTYDYSRPTISLSTVAVTPQSACSYSSFPITVSGVSGLDFGTSGYSLTDYTVLQASSNGTNYWYNGTPVYIFLTYEPIGTNFTTNMEIEPSGYPISTDMVVE